MLLAGVVSVEPNVWNRKYVSPASIAVVCVVEYRNGSIRVYLELSFTSRTNWVPGLLTTGPCGNTIILLHRASPVLYFTSSRRPYISGEMIPPLKDRA